MRIPGSLAWLAILALAIGQADIAGAQTSLPHNDRGVAFSQVALEVPDFDAHVQFWTALGGSRLKVPSPPSGSAPAPRFALIEFPNMTIAIRDGQGKGGTVGSTINHIGFQVPDTAQAVARFQAAGMKVEMGTAPGQAFVTAPDDIRIEILPDPSLTIPIRGHHVHFFGPAPLETQAWYAKLFGAIPGKRAIFDAADITASATVMNLTFSKADDALAPTKGRILDHIAFDVEGLAAFLEKAKAEGVQIEQPLTMQPTRRIGTAFLIDPWGTRVELIDQKAGRGE